MWCTTSEGERPTSESEILAEIQMRHNKIIGWERFFEVVEKVQKFSPWLSRQIAKRASEWPFWFSGVQIMEWREGKVWVRLPRSGFALHPGDSSRPTSRR